MLEKIINEGLVEAGISREEINNFAKKLNVTLDKATFDYSLEEFNDDVEKLSNENGEVSEEEKQSFKEKFTESFSKTKEGVSNLFSKLVKNKIDPVDEIKKYKELLDLGVISQEEFDKKKKELLNL